jgi:hypothetical protein
MEKEKLRVEDILTAMDIMFVPGGFYRFVKKEEAYLLEHNVKSDLGGKAMKYVGVPVIELSKLAFIASSLYGLYDLMK